MDKKVQAFFENHHFCWSLGPTRHSGLTALPTLWHGVLNATLVFFQIIKLFSKKYGSLRTTLGGGRPPTGSRGPRQGPTPLEGHRGGRPQGGGTQGRGGLGGRRDAAAASRSLRGVGGAGPAAPGGESNQPPGRSEENHQSDPALTAREKTLGWSPE